MSSDTVPLVKSTPLFASKCALTSAEDGPVYVITPDALLYARLPSPPASVTEIAALPEACALASVK